jgi:high-affinity iron transporter
MDFSAAIPTFIITLREGVEATLVAGIVLAVLVKADRKQLIKWVYLGAIGGVLASSIIGAIAQAVIGGFSGQVYYCDRHAQLDASVDDTTSQDAKKRY